MAIIFEIAVVILGLFYILCGTAVGLLSGLFGIGGGIVGIPLLLFCFAKQGMTQSLSVHMAVGTMLAVALATTFSALFKHHKNQLINVTLFKTIAPFLAAGGLLGTFVSARLDAASLQRIFALLLIFAALRMLLKHQTNASNELPGVAEMRSSSLLIGMLSGLLGLGGGVLLVPYLTWRGVDLKNAIATATACIVPAALLGTIGFLSMHPVSEHPIAFSTGYIYWPAFLGVSIMSTFVAPIGASITHRISAPILRTSFSAVLVAVAVHLAR